MAPVARTVWALLIVVGLTSCSPTRPSCNTEEVACLLSQYAYDVDRMPPRFSASFELASSVNFDEVADELEEGEIALDAVASAHLLQAYFETSAGQVCANPRFRAFLENDRERIQSSGPDDARALMGRVTCEVE